MIGSVAIQRLLESAILLKLERGTRGSEAQSSTATGSSTSNAVSQLRAPISSSSVARGQNFTRAGTWSNAPVIPADIPVAIAVASTMRETAVAPLAYRETVSDAASPAGRAPEQAPVPTTAVPAPIQYAHAELALALSRMKPGVSVVDETAAQIAQAAGAARSQTQKTEFATKRQAKIIGLICGSAVVLATLAVLIFG